MGLVCSLNVGERCTCLRLGDHLPPGRERRHCCYGIRHVEPLGSATRDMTRDLRVEAVTTVKMSFVTY
jgi:hypothetical protein